MPPEFVADLRAKYDDAAATLQAAIMAGDERKTNAMRQLLESLEERARTGIVGDQPEALTAEDEEVLDRVWGMPLEKLAPADDITVTDV